MATLRPELAEFLTLAAEADVVPVAWEAASDLETPISLYRKLRPLGAIYLLESAEQDGRFGRYSFIGLRPFARLEADARQVRVWIDGACERSGGSPLAALRRLLGRHRPPVSPPDGLPPFWGGAVGYFGYELIHHLERVRRLADDGSGWPEAAFLLAEEVVAVDHFRHRLTVVHSARPGRDPRAAYTRAAEGIERIRAALRRPAPGEPLDLPGDAGGPPGAAARANMTAADHARMIEVAREHIRQGDIFQVVLSQRLSRPFAGDPLDVYRVLRSLNPSPYMFFLDLDGAYLVGASPEMLVRVADGVVQTRPIAGTRPRGATAAEDAALEEELRADPKENAEHVMLVDLGRNDIGRVAAPGTVQVPEQLAVQRFSHVMHLVSSVHGRLRPDLDAFDALAACFPAGTLTGAPKVRAMEIIAALEPHRRGPYGGCVAYFGYGGNMDSAICIRTLALRDGVAAVQAGGGIVFDSQPAREYQETLNKAGAVLRALDLAEGSGAAATGAGVGGS